MRTHRLEAQRLFGWRPSPCRWGRCSGTGRSAAARPFPPRWWTTSWVMAPTMPELRLFPLLPILHLLLQSFLRLCLELSGSQPGKYPRICPNIPGKVVAVSTAYRGVEEGNVPAGQSYSTSVLHAGLCIAFLRTWR